MIGRYCVQRVQRGIATVMTAFVLMLLVLAGLAVALNMSASDIHDSSTQGTSAQALFLAESGLERVARRLAGTACGAGLMEGAIAYGGGQFQVVAPTPSLVGGQCQVRIAGRVGPVTRTVDAWFAGTGGAITIDTVQWNAARTTLLSFAHPVTAGASVLVVGVSIDRANTSINYVRYGGVNLTQIAVAFSGTNPEASIWYMVNPPAGTANVTISLGGNEEVIAGAISLFGVNTTTPFDVAAATSTGNGNAASVTITPVTSGAWVFDVMAVNNGKDVTPTAAGQTQHWESAVNNRVTGAASTIGPVNPAAPRTPRWTWTGSAQAWAHAAVTLRPGGVPRIVRWSEVPQ
jgi:hypothetical protein